ncbi:Uncharacterised protein [uncultured archaeon]|nr:Uncharacterised protein [uncultured archaeon]
MGINIGQRVVDIAPQGIDSGLVRASEYGAGVYMAVLAQFDALEVRRDRVGVSRTVAGIARCPVHGG